MQVLGGFSEGIYGDLLEKEMEERTLASFKYEQSFMMNEKHFEKEKLNHNLFCDDNELYRSCTRINTKKLQFLQKKPILVCIDSYFTKLLIWNCHEDEHHCRLESIIRLLKEDKL